MSSLQNILNPVDGRRRKVKLVLTLPDNASTSELPSSPATSLSELSGSAKADSSNNQAHINHEPHLNCPDSLRCLPDTDGRPQHTLPVILRCAILGSPQQRLTIREIYAAMESKYIYYQSAGPTWKQSVRHHLSLNRLFERRPRPVTDPGFGSYWIVNLTAPPGTKRPRKRGRANKDPSNETMPAKKRGRPPKISLSTNIGEKILTPLDTTEDDPTPLVLQAKHNLRQEVEYDGGNLELEDDPDVGYGSEDDYESEEELPMHPMDRHSAVAGLTSFGPPRAQRFTLPPFSSLREGSDNMREHLEAEIENLRRQSAEAVSLSLRLSEQLVHAQEESSRTRTTLRTIEGLLEDETKRRREAERAVDSEEKRRRKAESALSDLLSPSTP